MPITITLPAPGSYIGPGSLLQYQTSVNGPFPIGSTWSTQIFLHDGVTNEKVVWNGSIGASSSLILPVPIMTVESKQQVTAQPKEGDQVDLLVELFEPSGVVDSGSLLTTWSPTAALAEQQLRLPSQQSGLTPTQEQLLEETHDSVFPSVSIDALLLSEVTNGPQGGFVGVNLTSVCFGVIVRIANVPPTLTPGTPDEDYWVPSLAVVRVFRGSDLWLRVPVHTSSKIISLAGEGLVVALAKVLTNLWLLNLSLQVTFRAGVTGQVFLMLTP